MKDLLIIDFNDSFIHNICEMVSNCKRTYELVHYSQIRMEHFNQYKCVLLGPGPGHIDEYQDIMNLVFLSSHKNIVGICLGFQMLGKVLGLELEKKSSPLHGVSVSLPSLPNFRYGGKIKVQFYNSWGLLPNNKISLEESLIHNNYLVYLKQGNFKGCQFHPESIGTIHSKELFEWLLGDFPGNLPW